MACSTFIICTGLPERLPAENVEIDSLAAGQEHRVQQVQIARSCQRVALAHLLCDRAECCRAGDVRGAAGIGAAGIHEQHSLRRELRRRLFGRIVVHLCRVGPIRGDGSEAQLQKSGDLCAEMIEVLCRGELRLLRQIGLVSEPEDEICHLHRVLQIDLLRIPDLRRVLHRLHELYRAGLPDHRHIRQLAALLDEREDPIAHLPRVHGNAADKSHFLQK